MAWRTLPLALGTVLGFGCHGLTPVPAPGAAVAAVGSAPDDAQLERAGYHRQMRQGRVVYCRVESVTGSRFSSTVCASREQIEAGWEAAQRAMQDQRVNTDCTLDKACSGSFRPPGG